MFSQTSNTISAHSRITNDSNDKNFTKIITFRTNDGIKLPTSIPFPLASSNNENHQNYTVTSINNNDNNDNNNDDDGDGEDLNINELGNKIINRLYSFGLISKDINYSSDESDTSSTSWINQENPTIKNYNTTGRNNASNNTTNNDKDNGDYDDEDEDDESNENESRNDNNIKKIYNCKINLKMFRGESKYNVDLYFLYQSKDHFYENSKNGFINSRSSSNEGFMELPPNLYITFEELINYLRDKIFLSGINKNFHGIETKINILLKLKSFKCFINDKEFKLQKKKKQKT